MWDRFKQSSSSVDIEHGNRSTPWTLSRAIQAANLHVAFAASQFARSHCRIADDNRAEACGLLAPIGVVKWLFRTDPEEAGSLTACGVLLVVFGLLIGRKAGMRMTGGKRVAQR
jgi:hypothetical protein